MKKEIKEKWLAALRSGEYQQGTGALKREDKYCCLGVLCNEHAKETGGEWDNSLPSGPFIYLDNTGSLPSEVIEWAGLAYRNPQVKYKAGWAQLAHLNDHLGLDFKEIADLIEVSIPCES